MSVPQASSAERKDEVGNVDNRFKKFEEEIIIHNSDSDDIEAFSVSSSTSSNLSIEYSLDSDSSSESVSDVVSRSVSESDVVSDQLVSDSSSRETDNINEHENTRKTLSNKVISPDSTCVKVEENINCIESQSHTEVLQSLSCLDSQHERICEISDKESEDKHFFCKFCNKMFNRNEELEVHLRTHTGEKCKKTSPKKSHRCDISSPENHSVLSALYNRAHLGQNDSHTTICLRESPSSSLPSSHLTSHAGEKQRFHCEFCDKSFGKGEELKGHLKIHTEEKRQMAPQKECHRCEICLTEFTYRSNLSRHLRIHTDDKKFPCKFCNRTFRRNETLEIHVRIHTGEKPYLCQFCKASFSAKTIYNKHVMRRHVGKKLEKRFSCSKCNACFDRKLKLDHHIINMHSEIGEFRFRCGNCDNIFVDDQLLQQHQKRCFGKDEKEKCISCNKCFSNKSCLDAHTRRFHNVKTYRCEECHKNITATLNEFEKHTKSHLGKKISCKVCKTKLSSKSHLRQHMQRHCKNRFKCSMCNESFALKGGLQQHFKTHTGVKPHVCCICQLRFYEKSQLRKHIKVHTGERPYSCGVCHKEFTRGTHLRVHLRLHTGELPYSCDVCGKLFNSNSERKQHLLTHSRQ